MEPLVYIIKMTSWGFWGQSVTIINFLLLSTSLLLEFQQDQSVLNMQDVSHMSISKGTHTMCLKMGDKT